MDLEVSGTQSRPSFWPPLFVLSHNNLNPAARLDDEGLTVKVMMTTTLRWADIARVDAKRNLFGRPYAVVRSGGWDYILHFRARGELLKLLGRARHEGRALTPAAEAFLGDPDPR